jgi:tRNA-dihydrouridine synthase
MSPQISEPSNAMSSSRGFWDTLPLPISALAPMEDVTDTVFRRIVASAAPPDVYFTEFVNADGLCSAGYDAVVHRLRFTEIERPIVAQIWGNKPENYLKAARMIIDMGFDGIDINMGCPVKKIVKTGACSALIENPSLAAELFHAAREGVTSNLNQSETGSGDAALPVSIKTRIGFKTKKTETWARFLLELNPAVLTIHGRIAKDMSDVPADWDEVRRVVDLRNDMRSNTLILGNGDVDTSERLADYPAKYGVDGVMVGRGIFRDLFIFRRYSEQDDDASAHTSFELLPMTEKIDFYKSHIDLYRSTWGDEKNFNVMKKFAKPYIAGFSGAGKLRNAIMETSNYSEMLEALEKWQDDS